MDIIGMLIIISIITVLSILLWRRTITAPQIAAYGIIGIAAGFAVPNLTVITDIEVGTRGMVAKINQDRSFVAQKADEVKEVVRKLEMMDSDIRKTIQALVQSISVILRIKNMHPTPPKAVEVLADQIAIMANYAWHTPEERKEAAALINNLLDIQPVPPVNK